MARFVFSLESVLKYRRSRRDLCRQLLARVLADDGALAEREAELSSRRESQLDEIRAVDRGAPLDIDRSIAHRAHAGMLQAELRLLARQRELLAGQIALCRQALVEADRAVKALEKIRDRRATEHFAEQERRANREMEDAWMALNAGEFAR